MQSNPRDEEHEQNSPISEKNKETGRDKRYVGRWKNLRLMSDEKNAIENNINVSGEKRNVGRWKNFRWLLTRKNSNDKSNDKRFFGRWRDLNNRLPNKGKRFTGSDVENNQFSSKGVLDLIPVDKDLINEISDINNFRR